MSQQTRSSQLTEKTSRASRGSLNSKTKYQVLVFMALSIISAMITSPTCIAMPAFKRALAVKQPDGREFVAVVKGDEWVNWTETKEGYTIAKGEDGYWYHVADYFESTPVINGYRADFDPPFGSSKSIRPRPSEAHLQYKMQALAASSDPLSTPPSGVFTGKILFILVQYSNQKATTTEAAWANLLANNVADYYRRASYGKVNLLPAEETSGTPNNGVIDWVTLPGNHPNTGSNTNIANQKITKEAIEAADPYVDFASFDTNGDGYVTSNELAVVVIVAGGEKSFGDSGNTVWGHAWDISEIVGVPVADGKILGVYQNGSRGYAQFGEKHGSHMATMGIIVHELGHLVFGLPDLYDTDNSSTGVGGWCVMSFGSWGSKLGDLYPGQTPVLPSAWIKVNRGWVTPVTSGNISLTASGNAGASSENTVYKATTGISTQYFLVENRQPAGYDLGLYSLLSTNSWGGLAIFHIDETCTSNTNELDRWVDLEEADHNENYTGTQITDLWYSGNGTAFNGSSSPSSRLYGGASSGVSLNRFSARGTVMTASIPKVPGGATLVSPRGTIYTRTPTYAWNAVADVEQYLLQTNSGSKVKVMIWYTKEAAGCASGIGTCSVTPTNLLDAGSGQWSVQTWSSVGFGPWSSAVPFTVSTPGAAALLFPSGTINGATPSYTWNAVPGATQYCLLVQDSISKSKINAWYTADLAKCSKGTGQCSVTPSTKLAVGAGKWYIQTYSPVGNGAWSQGMVFNRK